MRKNVIIASSIIASQLLSGCMITEVKKNMDEMHDATVSMNNKMNQTNDGVTATNENMEFMVKGVGKKETADTRKKEWEAVLNADSIGDKLAHAAAFHYSWEFQTNMPKIHDQAYMNEVYKESIEQFTEQMHSLIKSRKKTSASHMSNAYESMYAMAITMHRVGSLQASAAKKYGYAPVSLYSLFGDVLRANKAIKDGTLSQKDLPPYIDKGRVLMDDIVYMLRIRHNFLMAFAYGLSRSNSHGDEPGLFRKLGPILKSMIGSDWTPSYANSNSSRIAYVNTILQYAMDTRNLMIDNGIDPDYDGKIIKTLRNMDIDGAIEQATAEVAADGDGDDKLTALIELKATVEAIANPEVKKDSSIKPEDNSDPSKEITL